MNKKHIFGYVTLGAVAVMLSACQVSPVNATTSITSAAGAGSKTINCLVLADGSCQIQPAEFPGNNEWYVVNNIDTNPTFTPKEDGAKVKVALDGYLTNPNSLEGNKAVWEEFNAFVGTLIPEGFEWNLKEFQSANWSDDYYDNCPGAEVHEWKAYLYQVKYSWKNVDEYVSKTKVLMGASYDDSELKELEDAGTPWATWTKNEDGTYTWSEAYAVNYWSVFDIADQAMSSKYFDKDTMGLSTDNGFSVCQQTYEIGDSDPVTINVDNKNRENEDGTPKFISATGTVKVEKAGCKGSIIAGSTIVTVLAATGIVMVASKRRKETK